MQEQSVPELKMRGPESLDDLLEIDTQAGRYEGPEEPVDPKEEARKARLRSNMDGLVADKAPMRKPGPSSDLDRIFKVR